jgi:integrase
MKGPAQAGFFFARSASANADDPRPNTALTVLLDWHLPATYEIRPMRALLTKRLIDAAQPQAKPYELRDANVKGLILRVQPSGHKAWIIEWTRGKRRTLGAYSHLTVDQARAHASHAMAEYIQQGLPTIARVVRDCPTLERFLHDEYLPWAKTQLRGADANVTTILRAFPAFLDRPLDAITAADVSTWWVARSRDTNRYGQPVSKATLTRLVATLRAALSRAVHVGLIDRNPVLDVRERAVESKKIVRYLGTDERLRLRTALERRDIAKRERTGDPARPFADHLTPIVLLAMNTGMRRGELLALRWGDINLDGRMIVVRSEAAKNGRQRHLPLNREAVEVLGTWKTVSDRTDHAEAVFDIGDIKTAWGRVVHEAKLGAFRFHDLRHDFASRLVSSGVDLNTVRELLGHADIKMTLRYAHLAPEHLASAVEKLS